MSKPKRNEPCYCGSGKKYKQCHMQIDQESEREKRAETEAVRYVRRDMLKFAREEAYAEAFAKALPQYWGGYYELKNAEEMSQTESLWFFDWFLHDYALPDGSYVMDAYVAERYDALSSAQRAVVDAWKEAAPMGGYELTAYEGQTWQMRDFVTGEQFEVYEPGGRGEIEIGDVILGRLLPIQGKTEFSTSVAYLPQAELGDVKAKLDAARAEAPDLTDEQFMRSHNTIYIHHALAKAVENGRPPVARMDPERPDKKTQKIVRTMKRVRR